MQKTALLIVLGVFTVIGFLIWGIESKTSTVGAMASSSVKVEKKWDLPDILSEVSGIAYMGNNRLACVQDEDGIIFIYNLGSSSIEKEIEFGGSGDYEAITLVSNTAYVLRSDGTIFEIENFNDPTPGINSYNTPLKGKLNFEGLGYDKKNNRLLIALKEKSGDEYQPVYGFDLRNSVWMKEPVYKIEFKDPIFGILNQKVSGKLLRPSEITLHPSAEKIYILEGIVPKLLILDSKGKPEKIHILDNKQFPQAEGLTFGDAGEIYISNEGSRQPANILQISLTN